MTEPSLPLRDSFLLSPRTANYIAALLREGDKFDYSKWLQRVREEEARAKQSPVACAPRGLVAAEIGTQTNTSGHPNASPNSALAISYAPIPRVLWQVHHASSKVPEFRIRHRLEKVRDAWDNFQASRVRDPVYGYLEAVSAIVEHYKVRRKTKRLLRHGFKFAELPFDRNADPFSAVIRCTSDDNADSKTISKWARALRYASRSKEPAVRLRTFMKEAGGINACADLYARYFGR
jgi:hypothetical protein